MSASHLPSPASAAGAERGSGPPEAHRPAAVPTVIDPAKLIDGLQALIAHQPKSDRVWLVRTRHGGYEVTLDAGVRAAAVWYISWSVYCEVAWHHDLINVDLDGDPDRAARIAEVVAAYVPPSLRGLPARVPVSDDDPSR